MIYHERLSKMSNEELIAEAREYATEVGGNYEAELLEGLADRLEAAGVTPQEPAAWERGELIKALRDRAQTDSTAHSLMREAADALAAPVQIDEAKLAKVICASYENEQGLKIRDDLRTARAVAEWLRGGGQ